jgi:hypothetical protein
MGALCCSSLFGHTEFAHQLSHTISNVMKDHHFSSINQISTYKWKPKLYQHHIKSIEEHICKVTTLNSINVRNITGFSNDYIAYQIACYLSECIFSCNVIKFTIRDDIPIDEMFMKNSSLNITNSTLHNLDKICNLHNIIHEPDVLQQITIQFDQNVTSIINRVSFDDVFMTSYKAYIMKRKEHQDNIIVSRNTHMESLGLTKVAPYPENQIR